MGWMGTMMAEGARIWKEEKSEKMLSLAFTRATSCKSHTKETEQRDIEGQGGSYCRSVSLTLLAVILLRAAVTVEVGKLAKRETPYK